MRDLKTLWSIVLKEFDRISTYDRCIFLCHVIENLERSKTYSFTPQEEIMLKRDLFSRPLGEYGKKNQINRDTYNGAMWLAGDNEARLTFINNRIKQLS